MELKKFVETTQDVKITRSENEIVLVCYLERISPHNTEYEALLLAERKARSADQLALAELNNLVDSDYWASQLIDKDGTPLPVKEMDKIEKGLNAKIETLAETRSKTEETVLRNKAERIAYLCKGWDVTDDGAPVPLSADVLMDNFSTTFIVGALSKIEEAVFSPLA